MGYLGDQRVCDRCFEAKPPKRAKKRSRTSTVSEPVLQAEMLLTDSLGRPVRRFHFALTVNSFRWYKHQHEEESGRVIIVCEAYVQTLISNDPLYSFPRHD